MKVYNSISIIRQRFFVWLLSILTGGGLLTSCDYLDVVPEGTSSMENAFSMREPALRYLYTCYSYITGIDQGGTFELIGGDELWTMSRPYSSNIAFRPTAMGIAEGRQSSTSVINDRWGHFYSAIRDCNTFLDGMNTYKIPDLPDFEKKEWIAEAKVLKAWYHFCLLQMYGPVPIVKENLPVSASVDEVKVARNSVDEVVDYIVELIDEAVPQLPVVVRSNATERGRMTLPIALTIKAQTLVFAASPLYNCNQQLANLKNANGKLLFPQDESKKMEKWERAKEACREAVQVCMDDLGMELYTFPGIPRYDLSNTILRQMTLRNAICEPWNEELIWGNTKDWVNALQVVTMPILNPMLYDNSQMKIVMGVPIKVTEMFYSDHGVPIEEDKTWDYGNRFQLRKATKDDNLLVHEGSVTVSAHYNREPRFYAWVGFDQGVWYGQGNYDDSKPNDLYYWRVSAYSQLQPFSPTMVFGPVTGYVPKKYVHYETTEIGILNLSRTVYIWPNLRLSDLLLYYAEAINESEDSQTARDEAMLYADIVRARAGLPTIADAWTAYSNNPNKYKSQNGLREILQQERLIELCFEGKRFFDLRRWKTAPAVYNNLVQGWDLFKKEAEYFYKPLTIFEQRFGLKDYFFPISDGELTRNTNLVQNVGW